MARQRKQPRFDPYAILAALEDERATYILIGAFARVIEGSDEITLGVDLTPSTRPENLHRVELALAAINARRADGRAPQARADRLRQRTGFRALSCLKLRSPIRSCARTHAHSLRSSRTQDDRKR